MIQDVVNIINDKLVKFDFFEFSVLSYDKQNIVIAGSDDFMYYHNFEIHFHDVFAYIGNFDWQVNGNASALIEIVSGYEAIDLNTKYYVEIGNIIFKFNSKDGVSIYVIAKSISLNDMVVKYY